MGKKKNELVKELQSFKRKIKKKYDIDKIILFGSKAEERGHEDSDVDLILVGKEFQNQSVLKRSPPLYLEWDLEYPVDILCFTPQEFEEKKKQITLVREAVKSGVEV